MIEKMHERSNGPVFKIIFALVSLSFVLGGIGGGLIGSNNYAVKVNGDAIDQQAFSQAKSRQQDVLYQQMGERVFDLLDNPTYAAQFNQSVLNDLINERLLRQYATDLKLGISADQIKSEIVNSPAFQQDGKFSNALYQQTLRNNGISADGYAAIVNEGMLQAQLQEGILNTHFSTPAQRALFGELMFQKREIRVATYPLAAAIAAQTASAEELKAYYEAHKSAFVEPEKFVVEYVTLTPKALEGKIQVNDEQIKTYYDTNKAQYVSAGEAKIAHIQFTNEADAQAALEAVKKGENFADLAKKSEDKLTANNGGELGWAAKGVFPAAFEAAIEPLKAGEVSNVVKVDNAFHLIKVLERKAETAVPLEQVKASIKEIIQRDLLLTEYSNTAREMANKAFENQSSLDAVAQVAGTKVEKTAQFSRNNLPAALSHEKVQRALFDGDLKQSQQNSEAIEIGDEHHPQTILFRVSDYQAERSQTEEEAKTALEAAVKREKAEKTLLAQADSQLKALNEGKTDGVKFGAAQTLEYTQAMSESPEFAQSVFAMAKPEEGKPNYQISRNPNGDVLLVALDKVEKGDGNAVEALKNQFNQAEILQLRNELLNDLREKASIDINQDFIDQTNQQSSH